MDEPPELAWTQEKLVKIGAKVVTHSRYVIFWMAEAALPRTVFAGILGLIHGMRRPPAVTMPA